MAVFFPKFDDQFEKICRETPLLPDADIEQLRSDIVKLAWGGPSFHRRTAPPQAKIKKLLKGIKSTTERHLEKISKLYTVEIPYGKDQQIMEEFCPDIWLYSILEHLEQTKIKVDAVLGAAPAKFDSGPLADKSFPELITSLKIIYKKYTGKEATSQRPSVGEPTTFQKFAETCAIALDEKIISSFYDKIHDAM